MILVLKQFCTEHARGRGMFQYGHTCHSVVCWPALTLVMQTDKLWTMKSTRGQILFGGPLGLINQGVLGLMRVMVQCCSIASGCMTLSVVEYLMPGSAVYWVACGAGWSAATLLSTLIIGFFVLLLACAVGPRLSAALCVRLCQACITLVRDATCLSWEDFWRIPGPVGGFLAAVLLAFGGVLPLAALLSLAALLLSARLHVHLSHLGGNRCSRCSICILTDMQHDRIDHGNMHGLVHDLATGHKSLGGDDPPWLPELDDQASSLH